MGCDSPLKGWKDRDTGGITFRRENGFGEKMEVGCGQCLGCSLDYRRMWAMRITHESSLHEFTGGNCFITLTYRDMRDCNDKQLAGKWHIPDDWSLHKSHFTNFMKRLRKAFPDQKIRYFYAGEYGRKCKHGIDVERIGCPLCNVGRPHFHACLFNCSFEDLEAYQSDNGIMRYTSPMLEKIWKFGFVDVGELNFSSASYTAGYVLKKVRGAKNRDHYMSYDMNGEITFISPEFVGMSRGRPCRVHRKVNRACPDCEGGIGSKWLMNYVTDVYPSDEVPIPGYGIMKGVPRYYDDIMKVENPELIEKVKEGRLEYMKKNGKEYTFERLYAKHKCKKAREKLRERPL